ncbi:MAG: ATP-binding protein [Clostridiales bacterium]|jgi:anti-sigma regulatory factor (Ser/Thr protein kinase)|nr:ATP-binding protein [Clostridiales bacterium]
MPKNLKLHYDISGEDYTRAGEASAQLKQVLRQLGLSSSIIRRVSIAMYEGEINMVIHANGGTIDVEIDSACVSLILKDTGPGISEIDLAMKEGYSTASESVRSMGFGAGMGLPNMRKHSDYMKIDSTPGVGTTVYMKIALGEE